MVATEISATACARVKLTRTRVSIVMTFFFFLSFSHLRGCFGIFSSILFFLSCLFVENRFPTVGFVLMFVIMIFFFTGREFPNQLQSFRR